MPNLPPRTHRRGSGGTVCGRGGRNPRFADDPAEVTCMYCQRGVRGISGHPAPATKHAGQPKQSGPVRVQYHIRDRPGRELMDCANNCGAKIRLTRPEDRIDPRDYKWVHEDGNPICGLTLVASPGGDGNAPAPVIGYMVDGRLRPPPEVTPVRRDLL